MITNKIKRNRFGDPQATGGLRLKLGQEGEVSYILLISFIDQYNNLVLAPKNKFAPLIRNQRLRFKNTAAKIKDPHQKLPKNNLSPNTNQQFRIRNSETKTRDLQPNIKDIPGGIILETHRQVIQDTDDVKQGKGDSEVETPSKTAKNVFKKKKSGRLENQSLRAAFKNQNSFRQENNDFILNLVIEGDMPII